MILVTVGTGNQPFTRLLTAVDGLVETGFFGRERVFMQIGNADGFVPRGCEYRDFLSMTEFHRSIEDSRLVVTHGGGGTLIASIRRGKRPVAVPRRRKYGEAINDHQLQLVIAFSEKGLVVPAFEVDALPEAIVEAQRKPAVDIPESQMIKLVGAEIDHLISRKERSGSRSVGRK